MFKCVILSCLFVYCVVGARYPLCSLCRFFFLHGVFPCGLLCTVCICWDFILFGGMAHAGVVGKWYDVVERQGFVWREVGGG